MSTTRIEPPPSGRVVPTKQPDRRRDEKRRPPPREEPPGGTKRPPRDDDDADRDADEPREGVDLYVSVRLLGVAAFDLKGGGAEREPGVVCGPRAGLPSWHVAC